MDNWVVVLDWLDSKCTPNVMMRTHYMTIRKLRKKKKERSRELSSHLPKAKGDANIPIKVIFNTPTRRRLDLDNALAAIKGELDGIADCIGVDDSLFRPILIDYGETGKPGSIKVTLRYEAI